MNKLFSSLRNKLLLVCAIGLAAVNTNAQYMHWQSLPINMDRVIQGFMVDDYDSSLYAFGNFDKVNGDTTGALVKINRDFSFERLITPYRSGLTQAMIRWNNELYAGHLTRGLHVWRSGAWQFLDSNMAYYTYYPYQGKLLIGGLFQLGKDDIGKQSMMLVSWDGSQFSSFYDMDTLFRTTGSNAQYNSSGWSISTIQEYKGKIYVAGNFKSYLPGRAAFENIACFNPQTQKWESVGGGIKGNLAFVSKMLVKNDTLYVGGYFKESWGNPGNGIVKWDGANWHKMGQGVDNSACVYDMAIKDDRLYMVGPFTEANGSTAYHVTSYNNGQWCHNTDYMDNVAVCIANFYGKLIIGGGFLQIQGQPMGHIAMLATESGCFPTSVSNHTLQEQDIVVSPNPSGSVFRITLPAPKYDALQYTVYNGVGQKVFYVQSKQPALAIDASSWSEGVYFLEVSSADKTFMKKLLKK